MTTPRRVLATGTVIGLLAALPPGSAEAAALLLGSPELSLTAPPTGAPELRRFLVALLTQLGGIAMGVHAWQVFSECRRLQGLALALGGSALAFGGMVLLRLNAYPATWDWWI